MRVHVIKRCEAGFHVYKAGGRLQIGNGSLTLFSRAGYMVAQTRLNVKRLYTRPDALSRGNYYAVPDLGSCQEVIFTRCP